MALKLGNIAPMVRADADIGARSGQLGVEIADLAGTIADLAQLGQIQQARSKVAQAAIQTMTETNGVLVATMRTAKSSAYQTQETLAVSADEFAATISNTVAKIRVLGDGATALHRSIEDAGATIDAVRNAGEAIQRFAYDTQLLAVNARIEAAHAGSAGAGFAVIAGGVETLAENIRTATAENQKHLELLTHTLATLMTTARSNAEGAEEAKAETEQARATLAKFQALVETIERLMHDIDSMSQSVEQNNGSYDALRAELVGLTEAVQSCVGHLDSAHVKAESILGIAEDFILFVAQSGIRNSDSAIIDLCRKTAGKMSTMFERALANGDIDLAALFDETYVPISRTDPQQFMTRFVAFTDAKLRALQEDVLTADPRISFCAAADRNGYLPTHNLKYSKPQGRNPVWNAANCRNRRIFDDRTGLSAGRNQRPFLLQTYRRDMGGGAFVMMKDVSAPITVNGRHWGGLRIGFKV
jgi:methyl-accepting chemotaxis protein